MKQKILTLLFAVFMMAVAFSVKTEAAETEEIVVLEEAPVLERMTAFADQVVFSGTEEQVEIYDAGYCNDTVIWGITPDGILIITTLENTRGTMPWYDTSAVPWSAYKEYIWAAKRKEWHYNI